jgi:hypothetical protein
MQIKNQNFYKMGFGFNFSWRSILDSDFDYVLLFTILRLFGTKKSIRRKVNNEG